MPSSSLQISKKSIAARYRKCAIKATRYPIAAYTLSQFLEILSTLLTSKETYWFRGHTNTTYKLIPSALRYQEEAQRAAAIDGIREVQQVLSYRLDRPPAATERLNWLQIAQHYGFPTRLLDWTQNPVVALYFACCHQQNKNGLVVVMRPVELNTAANPLDSRLYNA